MLTCGGGVYWAANGRKKSDCALPTSRFARAARAPGSAWGTARRAAANLESNKLILVFRALLLNFLSPSPLASMWPIARS